MSSGLRTILLAVHVGAGALALLLALGLLAGRRGWAGAGGATYLVAVLTTCGTAAVLASAGISLPMSARVVLLVVALLTAAAAASGVRRARRGSGEHLRLLHGSVVSLVTAVAVVSAPVVVWVVVTAVGTVLVEVAAHRRRSRRAVPVLLH